MKRTFKKQVFLTTTACFFLVLIGCGGDDGADTIDSGPTDTDIDADTDTDGDSDADTETNTNTDTDTDTDGDSGTETIPFDSFETTGCLSWKKGELPEMESEGYGDLECVIWEKTESDQLILSILGYKPSYCGSLPEPVLFLNGQNDITLSIGPVEEEDCVCCYEMELSFSRFTPGEDVLLTLETQYEETLYGSIGYWSTVLPTSSETNGVKCRYPIIGALCKDPPELHSACHLDDYEGCPDDLVCKSPLDGGDGYNGVCMKTCIDDTDCPLDFLFCGDDGFCRFEEDL